MHFDAEPLCVRVQEAAQHGVLLGTSSWKYPGWCGQLYDEQRYLFRGKFSESRFDRDCLREYAECFSTVCVDAAYYRFPEAKQLVGLAEQVPEHFCFSFKVTDEITIKKFTHLPRFGNRAGQLNENFLNAELFVQSFLKPCEAIREKVGLLMFEFSKFHKGDWENGRQFVLALDHFLGQLPRDWHYGVELRNHNFLQPEYFATLAKHGVTHVYNNWQAMPSIGEQMRLEGSETNPDLVAGRFLLKPGRKYEEAVELFSPYDAVKEPDPEARQAGAELIRRGRKKNADRTSAAKPARTFIYVNNRLEGNALQTISAMLELARQELE